MRSLVLAVVLSLANTAAADPAAISRVLGSIDVDPGQTFGKVSTVNGGIAIGANAVVAAVETVNGSVTLGMKARAESLTTVNGGITLQTDSKVVGRVTTVNGSLVLSRGSEVGAELRNVNGSISVDGAHVSGRIRTSTGSIETKGGARLEGGILVDDNPNNWGPFTWGTPRIVIGPGTTVVGPLQFQRKVTLFISDHAVINGPIDGAVATRYSGDKPPG